MNLQNSKASRQLIKLFVMLVVLAIAAYFAAANSNSNSLDQSFDKTEGIFITRETNESNEQINKKITEIYEKIISINLSYESGTPFDEDDDGIAYKNEVIDFTVAGTVFNWNVNKEKLCTRWKTLRHGADESTIVCYGSEQCCNFVGLAPISNTWNEIFYSYYGKYGPAYNNTVSAQVIYVDYNTSINKPYSEVYYSEWYSLSAVFIERTAFILTKISNLIVDKINVFVGAIISIQAKLSYINESPMQLENVDLYKNGSLIKTGITDLQGYVIFEINTSKLGSGEHLFNLTFKGKEVSQGKHRISIMPSYNLTFIEVLHKNETAQKESFQNITFNPVIKDSLGNEVDFELEIINLKTNSIEKKYKKKRRIEEEHNFLQTAVRESITHGKPLNAASKDLEDGFNINKGKYDINAFINNSPVKKIEFNDVNLTSNITDFLGLDDVPEEKIKEKDFVEVYAIDPTNLNFTDAVVSVVAKGTELYKCKEWNFSLQECYGEWVLFKEDLVPGQEYTFILTPDDPGFGEIIINATDADHLDEDRAVLKSVYDEIKAKDDVWTSAIPAGHYVRVSFEEELGSSNDITIYTRSNSTSSIEVYEENGGEIIATFENLNGEAEYKAYLTGMKDYDEDEIQAYFDDCNELEIEEDISYCMNAIDMEHFEYRQDTFDLKIIGGAVEFDLIIDPIEHAPIGEISNLIFNATMLNKSLYDPGWIVNISDDVYAYVAEGLYGHGWVYTRNWTTDELIDEFDFYGAGELEAEVSDNPTMAHFDGDIYLMAYGDDAPDEYMSSVNISSNGIINGFISEPTQIDATALTSTGYPSILVTEDKTVILTGDIGTQCRSHSVNVSSNGTIIGEINDIIIDSGADCEWNRMIDHSSTCVIAVTEDGVAGDIRTFNKTGKVLGQLVDVQRFSTNGEKAVIGRVPSNDSLYQIIYDDGSMEVQTFTMHDNCSVDNLSIDNWDSSWGGSWFSNPINLGGDKYAVVGTDGANDARQWTYNLTTDGQITGKGYSEFIGATTLNNPYGVKFNDTQIKMIYESAYRRGISMNVNFDGDGVYSSYSMNDWDYGGLGWKSMLKVRDETDYSIFLTCGIDSYDPSTGTSNAPQKCFLFNQSRDGTYNGFIANLTLSTAATTRNDMLKIQDNIFIHYYANNGNDPNIAILNTTDNNITAINDIELVNSDCREGRLDKINNTDNLYALSCRAAGNKGDTITFTADLDGTITYIENFEFEPTTTDAYYPNIKYMKDNLSIIAWRADIGGPTDDLWAGLLEILPNGSQSLIYEFDVSSDVTTTGMVNFQIKHNENVSLICNYGSSSDGYIYAVGINSSNTGLELLDWKEYDTAQGMYCSIERIEGSTTDYIISYLGFGYPPGYTTIRINESNQINLIDSLTTNYDFEAFRSPFTRHLFGDYYITLFSDPALNLHQFVTDINTNNPVNVTLINPVHGSQVSDTNNITFNISVTTSGIGLANCTLWHNVSGWQANETNFVSGFSNVTNWTVNNVSDGNYIWNSFCCDTWGECLWADSNFSLEVSYAASQNDLESPNVSLVYPANGMQVDPVDDSFNITINCSATDNVGLENISLYITNSSNGSFSFYSSTSLNGLQDNASFVVHVENLGNYTWNCLAYDSNGNSDWNDINWSFSVNYSGNFAPTHSNPILNSTSKANYSSENLTCYNQSTYDQNGDAVKNIFNWKRNGTNYTLFHFTADSSESNLKNYISGSSGVNYNANWSNSYGRDGFGAWDLERDNSEYIESDEQVVSSYPYSISMWFKPEASMSGGGAVFFLADSTVSDKYFGLNIEGSQISLSARNTAVLEVDGSTISMGGWHHVVLVFKNETYRAMYLDGSFDIDNNNTVPYFSPNRWSIGRKGDSSPGDYFDGIIDDIIIFNSALSIEQIIVLNNSRTDLIVSQETSVNENWLCEVIPVDSSKDGIKLSSNNLTVLNSPPSIIQVLAINELGVVGGDVPRGENVTFNATVTDLEEDIDKVWVKVWNGSIGTSTVIWQDFLSFISGDLWSVNLETNESFSYGPVNYTVYANDTAGHEVNLSTNFTVVNSAPSVNITYPLENQTVNGTINISWIVTDLQSDSYLTNVSANNSLTEEDIASNLDAAVSNTSWNTSAFANGYWNLTVQACENATSELLCGNNTIMVYVNNSDADFRPIVVLDQPLDNYEDDIYQYVNITFNASVTDDINLANCSLWHNATGAWHLNQTQAVTGTSSSAEFNLTNMGETTFIWNIQCYDNKSQSSFASSNRTIILNWVNTTVLTGCEVLNSSNTIYTLIYDVNSSGTCFNITADNITLNCDGYAVNFSETTTGYGVISDGYNNLTIKDCNLNSPTDTTYPGSIRILNSQGHNITNVNITNVHSTQSGASYWFGIRFDNVNGSHITNVILNQTNGRFSNAISLYSGSNNNVFENLDITIFGSYQNQGIGLDNSDYNNFSHVNFYRDGENNNYGFSLALDASDYNIFNNFSIEQLGDANTGESVLSDRTIGALTGLVFLYSSSENEFYNFNITSKRSTGFGFDGSEASHYNHTLVNNTLNYGNVNYTKDLTNTVIEGIDNSQDTYIFANYQNVTIRNNNFTDGGIYLPGGFGNTIESNNFVRASQGYGIFTIARNSPNCSLINNYFENNVGDSDDYNIAFASSDDVLLKGNTLYCNADVSNSFIYFADSNNAEINDTLFTKHSKAIRFENSHRNEINNFTALNPYSSGCCDYEAVYIDDSHNNTFKGIWVATNQQYQSPALYLNDNGDNNYFENFNFSALTTLTSGSANRYPYGIFFEDGTKNNITFVDGYIHSEIRRDIYAHSDVDAGSIILINVTYNKSDFETASANFDLFFGWHLDINVTSNATGLQIENASVSSWQKNGVLAKTTLTYSDGSTRHDLIEFKENTTGKYYGDYSNYTINVTKAGYSDNSQSVNISDNSLLNIAIENNPPNVTLVYPSESTQIGITNNITFNVSATIEETGLSNCTLWTNVTGSWKENETNELSGFSNTTNWTLYNISDGNYTWNSYCCDVNNKCSFSESNVSFEVIYEVLHNDVEAPNVSLIYPSNGEIVDPEDENLNIKINCSVTDNFGLKNISLYITNSSNGSFSYFSGVNVNGVSANASFVFTGENFGNYTWNCLAYDSNGNSDWGDVNWSFSVNFSGNFAPTHNNPILNSSFGTNLTNENLTCYNQSTYDQNGNSVKNIFNWKKDNAAFNLFNMPMELNSSNVRDYVNGKNGSGYNAIWNSTGGYDGKGAYEFNGIDSYIEGNDKLLTDYPFSMSAWVKANSVADKDLVIVNIADSSSASRYAGLYLDVSGTNFRPAARSTYGTTQNAQSTINIADDGKWHFIVGVWDNSTMRKIYIDGDFITYNDAAISFPSGNNRWGIGRWQDSTPKSYFNGTIDDVMIFNATLSAEQIKALYNNRTDLIVSSETTKNETWQCEVTPSDGVEDGTSLLSDNLTILNSPPGLTQVQPVSAITLSAFTTKTVNILFNVTDNDGYSDLNDSLAWCSLTKTGEAARNSSNLSACTAQSLSENSLVYNCSLDMQYYDAAGLWNISCYAEDTSGLNCTNKTETSTVNELNYVIQNVTNLNWAVLIPGTYDIESSVPVVFVNGGNQDYAAFNITAQNATYNSSVISRDNFMVDNETGKSSGQVYLNGSGINWIGGHLSSCKDPCSSNSTEQMYVYVDTPIGISAGTYTSISEWVISLS